MSSFLPSKKFLITFGSIILVGLFIFIFGIKFNKSNQVNNKVSVNVTNSKEISEQDTDNDGLYDWEEILWKTDPNNPDTDGDGILDGQEVENQKKENTQNVNDSEKQPNTQTEAFAQLLYLFASANPNADQQSINSFVDSSLEIFRNTEKIKYFTIDDVVIGGNVTPGSYYDDLSIALSGLKENNKSVDLFVIDGLINAESKDSPAYSEMQNLIQKYDTAVDNMKKVVTPSTAVSVHLEILNSLSNISGSLRSIINNFDYDPTLALSSLTIYEESVNDFLQAMDNLEIYFETNGII